uniref:Ankyrin repeat-containing protein n=1 Tax=Rhabditophanes sp. KR3021 TaxID=114890 RepID=A0AC35TY09_9BILA
LNPDSDQNTIPPKEIPPSTISVVSQTHSEHSQPSKHSSSPLISIADIMKYKNNLDKKIKASFKMISLTIFVSAVSMTISAYRIDSFLANLPNSETRVSNNLRHQFEYGFWSLAFISTLFHLMLSTTLLIICLIHLYCAYSITKTMNNTDQAVMSYFNSTSIWRNIIAYFYLVSLMFTVVINTCLVFVVPANIGQYSKATIFATGAFLCIFIMMVAFHTLFKWCKLSKDDEKMCQYQPQQIYSPIHTHHGKIDIKSLSTLV